LQALRRKFVYYITIKIGQAETPPMARLSISYFVVNAFAEKPFAGNPAGICVLDRWLPAAAMQAIAAENGLPVTAFSGRR